MMRCGMIANEKTISHIKVKVKLEIRSDRLQQWKTPYHIYSLVPSHIYVPGPNREVRQYIISRCVGLQAMRQLTTE